MATEERTASQRSWVGRLAAATFVVLVAFGLLLLFVPDLARELDDRTAGEVAETTGPPASTTITETNRTTRSESRSDARSSSDRRSRSSPRSRGSGARRNSGAGTTATARGSKRQATQSTTETTTTTTQRANPAAGDGVIERTLGVPAVVVMARSALVALLAALVGALVARLVPRRRAVPEEETEAGPEASNPSPLPSVPVVNPDEAEAARTAIIDGIPVLREVFAARGEPDIDKVLPDMRVSVQLSETLGKEQSLPVSLFARDAALGLGSFRTELEQRLRRLARDADLQCTPSVEAILKRLTEEGLFEPGAAEGFRNLLRMTQRGLHSRAVDPALSGWIVERGVPLLLGLDLMLPS